MKFTYLYLVLSLVFTGLISEVATAAPRADAATAAISKIDGEGVAKVRRKSGIESVAGVKQELFAGDRITTDARSIVEVVLADGTLVRVGLNSEYRLESVQKKNGILTWVFGLAKGSIRALVEKNPNKNMVKFRVNTPVGTMGVRGTELVLDHNEKTKLTTLYTIEGRVEFGTIGCYLKRKCIEVKTGETASLGAKPSEQQPVAKPVDMAALLLMGNPKAKGAADSKDAKGTDQASVDAASADERLARAALFTDMKNAGALAEKTATGSIDAVGRGDIDKIVKDASDALAEAQDKLIGRTKAQRENLQESIKDGSYQDRLKLAEKFDDIQNGGNGKGKDREKENLNASAVNKKLSLADAILKSKKMQLALEKRGALDNGLIDAKLKAVQQKLSEVREKAELSKTQLVTDTATSTATATSSAVTTNSATTTSSATDTAVEDGTKDGTTSPEEVKVAVEEMDKEMADGIIGEPIFRSVLINYQEYDKCGFLELFCDHDVKIDGDWYDIKNKANLMNYKTFTERKGGKCYKSITTCGKRMIPCDLSKGKACTPQFEPYACKTSSAEIACPAN